MRGLYRDHPVRNGFDVLVPSYQLAPVETIFGQPHHSNSRPVERVASGSNLRSGTQKAKLLAVIRGRDGVYVFGVF